MAVKKTRGDEFEEVFGGLGETFVAGEEEEAGELSITVSADVSDVVTGFKALQRELRETAKAAREAESAIKALGEAKS